MKLNYTISYSLLILLFLSGLLSACKTNEVQTEGLMPRQLLQLAQTELDEDRYERALEYYNAIITQYPDSLEMLIEAKYEIGHIYFKQRKYEKCKDYFTKLLKEIEDIEAREKEQGAQLIPRWPKVLVLQHLEKIKNRKKGRFGRNKEKDKENTNKQNGENP